MEEMIREPRQKRAIEKKNKIIEAGFQLICQNGYYNTNTKEIALEAGVSTGIVYQYFKDKFDIFMDGLKKYGDDIFFPIIHFKPEPYDNNNFYSTVQSFISDYIQEHKISQVAHEEITAMIHSNQKVANYFYEKELYVTDCLKKVFLENHFPEEHLSEKIHIMMGLVDLLCHEIIYHKHSSINYDIMTEYVLQSIVNLFEK